MVHITAATSVENPSGSAFVGPGPGPGTLLVDANAFLISDAGGNGARFTGSWTATINGEVGAFGSGFSGMFFLNGSTVTIGTTGDVFGGSGISAIEFDGAATLKNFGTVSGAVDAILVAGLAHISNAGLFVGNIGTGGNNDVFTDFIKVGTVIHNGRVVGVIDLGDGADHFNGGTSAETVRDGGGGDTVKLGGGNDTYIAVKSGGGADLADTIDGSTGIDTYDGSGAVGFLTVNLTSHTASGDVGSDTVTGFENVVGGSGGNSLIGSSAANRLTGGASSDILVGLGARDILTGGGNGDTFRFLHLSDSGVTAATRDVITDFTSADIIDLSTIDARTGPGDNAFSFIGFSNFSGIKGQLRESFSGGNTIVSGDVTGDGHADFSFALAGHFLLSGSPGTDFVL